MIKTYKVYKELAINKAIEKEKDLSFDKIDDRYYYVYRITNIVENKHYYGSRVSKCEPIKDLGIKYFSSSRDKDFKEEQKNYTENFKYKVIKIFDNTKDKEIYESYLHQYFNVSKNDSFYNKSNQTPFGWDTTGMVNARDINTNETKYVSQKVFHDNDNLVSIYTGMVNAVDKTSGKNVYVTIEEYHNNDNLVSVHKGMVNAVDKTSGKNVYVSQEEFHNNNNLIGVTMVGRVSVRDINTNETKSVTKEEYVSNENLVHINEGKVVCKINGEYKSINKEDTRLYDNIIIGSHSGKKHSDKAKLKMSKAHKGKQVGSENPYAVKINIYNDKDELVFECNGDIEKICKENRLPINSIRNTYTNNTKLFESTYGLVMAKRRGDERFKGWYARKV